MAVAGRTRAARPRQPHRDPHLAAALGVFADTLIGVGVPTPTQTAAELLAAAEALNAIYQAARYHEALTACPPLLAEVDALTTRSDTL